MAWWQRRQPAKDDTAREEYLNAWAGDRDPAAAVEVTSTQADVLTAAANAVKASRKGLVPRYDSWQEEAWGLYDELGEFRYATDWLAEMTSRVRLRAARKIPGQDEPELIDTGPAAELIEELGGDVGGRAQVMATLSTLLSVPGEGYLTGEKQGKTEKWTVRSTDEIRARGETYEVIDELSSMQRVVWRPLASDSLIVRIHRPHKRFYYMADSPARTARGTMRELELVNRKITAQYLSRLASAGLIIIPSEVKFPVREEFQDSDDPFMMEWIETAAEAIRTPGTAASVVPIPMRIPGEHADKVKLIDFTLLIDEKDIDKRESAIKRLATQLDLPAEILLGIGDVNHWGQWQIEESAIKAHISPHVELITHGLTIGYLHPRLKAMGEDTSDLLVWYDASEITMRPDRSEAAGQAYDRNEISGEAYRRESGFDEADKPEEKELRDQILKTIARAGTQNALTALAMLMGEDLPAPAPPVEEEEENTEDPVGDEEDLPADRRRGPPDTKDEPLPAPGDTSVASGVPTPLELRQATAIHRIVVHPAGGWTLQHPTLCASRLFSCPVEHAVRRSQVGDIHPGTPGAYECWLSPGGELVTGRRAYSFDGEFIDGTRGGMNGHGANHGTRA